MNNQHLPGIQVRVADGGLILPEDAITESMLIIAPSTEQNPPEDPVLIRQSSDLREYGLGHFTDRLGNVNQVATGWKAAFEGGCRQIFVLALQGETEAERFAFVQDRLFGLLTDFNIDNVVLAGVYADKEATNLQKEDFLNDDAKDAFPMVSGMRNYGHIVEADQSFATPITIPEAGEGAENTFMIDGTVVTVAPGVYGEGENTISDLETAINADLAAISVQAVISEDRLVFTSETAFEVQEAPLLSLFNMTAQSSEHKHHPAGLEHRGNFAQLLADFAEMQSQANNSVVAFVGTTAPEQNNLSGVKAHEEKLSKLENRYSGHVQVVAGPEFGYRLPGRNSFYYMNGAISYAALVSTLRPESATTNKQIAGVSAISYSMSLRQLNRLTGNKYVTFRMRNGNLIVTDGVTTAREIEEGGTSRASDFTRLSTLRITNAAAELVREVCEPFIGEPNRMPQYNSLNSAITGALQGMTAAGALNDFRFSVVARGSQLNEAEVTLELIPAFELRKIRVNVSLNTDLPDTEFSVE